MKNVEKLTICVEALKELLQPKSAYDENVFKHAENTIKETGKIALEALEKIGEVKITNFTKR